MYSSDKNSVAGKRTVSLGLAIRWFIAFVIGLSVLATVFLFFSELKLANYYRCNRVGFVNGFGGCNHCGDRWNWKASHTTFFPTGHGVFVLCQDCWEDLEPKDRLPYYHQHFKNRYDEISKEQITLTVLMEGKDDGYVSQPKLREKEGLRGIESPDEFREKMERAMKKGKGLKGE